MSRKFKNEPVFLKVGFRSSERIGSLRTIELIGVPGERSRTGQYAVSEKTQLFFDDIIARKLFRDSRHLSDCNFEHLTIWLYEMDVKNEKRGYEVPVIDEHDLEIKDSSNVSSLERIYVLDNELTGNEYIEWKNTAEALFNPLFSKFITPPKIPDNFKYNPFAKLAEGLAETVDPHLKMKQAVFFNALIIQID